MQFAPVSAELLKAATHPATAEEHADAQRHQTTNPSPVSLSWFQLILSVAQRQKEYRMV